jgi:hypothetical protein
MLHLTPTPFPGGDPAALWHRLDPIQRDLLERVAAGQSVLGAARSIYVSRRTAWRRLAEARALFGVATNGEAIVLYQRLRDAMRD